MNHARDHEVFEGDPVVVLHQIVYQFGEVVFALIANPLMLPLQHHHGLAAVLPTALPSRDPALAETQLPFLRK